MCFLQGSCCLGSALGRSPDGRGGKESRAGHWGVIELYRNTVSCRNGTGEAFRDVLAED